MKVWSYLLLAGCVFINAGCSPASEPAGNNRNLQVSKVSPELTALYQEHAGHVASGRDGMFKPSNSLLQIIDDRVVVDATAAADAAVLKSDLEALGMRQAVAFGHVVSGQLPIVAIPQLASLQSLNFVRAAVALLQGAPKTLSPGTVVP